MNKLDELAFQLRFSSKQLERMSKRCQKEEREEKVKIKKALEKGNTENAKIYAENSIRKRNEATNFLRMAARVDGVASRVKSAAAMNLVLKNMGSVVKNLDKAINAMDLQKVSSIMEKFEEQFESLDVRSSVMEDTIISSNATTTPQGQVDLLIQQVADENGLELKQKLSSPATSVPTDQVTGVKVTTQEEDDALAMRLAALRN
ncbi:charged multivesicular body protein 1a-like [Tropilaelaps mercedesae]|uniref:Charged multivesicular body protein 1a-like n=1 Tax=Tropilaelaps mercedesae TaxID=418985 RepID=A0A1V9X5X8_9ACAR|nr:charged multivesicular body protein 1a-like [Tropilaelaps mercedesae]